MAVQIENPLLFRIIIKSAELNKSFFFTVDFKKYIIKVKSKNLFLMLVY